MATDADQAARVAGKAKAAGGSDCGLNVWCGVDCAGKVKL